MIGSPCSHIPIPYTPHVERIRVLFCVRRRGCARRRLGEFPSLPPVPTRDWRVGGRVYITLRLLLWFFWKYPSNPGALMEGAPLPREGFNGGEKKKSGSEQEGRRPDFSALCFGREVSLVPWLLHRSAYARAVKLLSLSALRVFLERFPVTPLY